MKNFIKSFYIHSYFFLWLLIVAGLFFVSFFVNWLYEITLWGLFVLFICFFVDVFLLYLSKNTIKSVRILPEKLSNSDENKIKITIENQYFFTISVEIIDELPFQFQKRNFSIKSKINNFEEKSFFYKVRPTQRGVFQFGKLNIFVSSPLKLITKRFIFQENENVASYPSFIQMKKYELMAFSKHLFDYGVKKVRRVGHTMEFDHIRSYIQGDDIRTINWKASSKQAKLMVNQYEDEKSQNIYMLIDKGRTMQMPFHELSLLDYAINTTLALSNIIIKKKDKAGIFSFSKKIEDMVLSERKKGQMHKIIEKLYRIDTDFLESDFNRLYLDISHSIKQRSLLLLFTNFETKDALFRQLPYLKLIAKKHLLVVIFFENTELNSFISKTSKNIQDVYDKIIAEKFIFEKRWMVQELAKHGILSILTSPNNLTINTINMYLELKAKGKI